MGKNFTAVFAVCLAISALPLACGDDDEGDDGDGGGGKGGSSGSTSGGTAGTGKGGTAGTGGSTGGTAGTAGKGGTGGTTGGSAGTAGMGGADGGMGGAEGGMGGEGGGGTEPTLCEQVCAGPPGACVTDCETTGYCAAFSTTPDCTDDTEAVLSCFAGDLGAASWACTAGVPQYAGDDCYDLFAAAYAAGCVTP